MVFERATFVCKLTSRQFGCIFVSQVVRLFDIG